MPKSKDSQVSLEEFGKSTFSCSDYLIFLDNPQLLRLILDPRLIRTESEGRTPSVQNKKPRFVRNRVFKKKGGDILSHITAVPSARAGLTTLFGMGRGEPRRNNHLKVVLQQVPIAIGNNYTIS